MRQGAILGLKSSTKGIRVSRETGKHFIEYTKYRHLEPSDQMMGISHPPIEVTDDDNQPTFDLPEPSDITTQLSVRKAINNRTSVREYSQSPLTQQELSYLLWATQGIKEIISGSVTLRTVPSAGARHAFETYLLINNVEQLNEGIYRYRARTHALIQNDTHPEIRKRIRKACFDQQFVLSSCVTFIWSAEVRRMTWRYNERGYRYLFLDAGHVCQNLYLSAESIGCGVCAVGAFQDDEMNSVLGLDGVERFVIYLASVGKK